MPFEVIPSIDISEGRVVRLVEGDLARKTEYGDPVDFAKQWAAAGVTRLHVVDIDGAFAGAGRNTEAVAQVIGAVDIAVQVAGGIRTIADAERWAATKADRVVLGTAALTDEAFLREALDVLGDSIVVAIDARDGIVRTKGWTQDSGLDLLEEATRMGVLGVARLLCTDIARDGRFTGPNLEQLALVAQRSGVPVIASGGVTSTDDLQRLASTPGIEGAIVGKALYDGRLDIEEALACLPSG